MSGEILARRKQRPVLPLDRRINVVLMTRDFPDNPVMQIMSSEGYPTRSDMTELDETAGFKEEKK